MYRRSVFASRSVASSAYSGMSPTSPAASGVAARSRLTVRVTPRTLVSTSEDASMPFSSQTASPTAPAATMPSPDMAGLRTTILTPEPLVLSSPDRASQLPPAALIRSPVAGSVTM